MAMLTITLGFKDGEGADTLEEMLTRAVASALIAYTEDTAALRSYAVPSGACHVATLTSREVEELERLADENDRDLWDLISDATDDALSNLYNTGSQRLYADYALRHLGISVDKLRKHLGYTEEQEEA